VLTVSRGSPAAKVTSRTVFSAVNSSSTPSTACSEVARS
jgi:hypothetical protein